MAKILNKERIKAFFTEKRIEKTVAIFLAVTALLNAWASWIGSLHGGNQVSNYTKSNNIEIEANAEYNRAIQEYLSDNMSWNSIVDYMFDAEIARQNGDEKQAQLIEEKTKKYINDNCSDKFKEALSWAFEQDEDSATPFNKEGYSESYFTDAKEMLKKAQDLLEEGQQDNKNDDSYGLVSVIFSIALFLLGIIGVYKDLASRKLILIVSILIIVFATIYMLTIPLPTGFNLFGFFK